MKIKYLLLTLLFLFSLQSIFAQHKLLFTPLAANVFEPRVAAMHQFQNKKLRLDIGTSLDLIELYKNGDNEIRFGTDFFTFTRLRSEGRMKFPVETTDYFFGINFSNKLKLKNLDISARLRISHISSHLIDGLSSDGKFEKLPFVYSREFLDYVIATDIEGFRPYAGINFIFSTIPKDVNKIIPQFGIELPIKNLKTSKEEFLGIKLSYDFKLTGYEQTYQPVHSVQLNFCFPTKENLGISLNLNAYSGLSMHGMFFKEKDRYISAGFQIIFF